MHWRHVHPLPLLFLLSLGLIHAHEIYTRGMTPKLQQTLSSATNFVCDSNKHISFSRMNDNYCDCDDGSDEPGTSACSHTLVTFYCLNTGYLPTHLPTSRVNDQLCDCCDGSDEYGTSTDCPNTCPSLMEALVQERQGLVEAYEQGRKERVLLVERAAVQLRQDQVRLVELQETIERQKQTVEEYERIKEKEEIMEEKEKKEAIQNAKAHVVQSLGLSQLSGEQLGRIILELITTEATTDKLLTLVQTEREASGLPLATIIQEEEEWKIREATRQKEAQEKERLKEEKKRVKEEAAEKKRQEALDRGEKEPEEEEEDSKEEEDQPLAPVEESPVHRLIQQLQGKTTVRPQATQAREALTKARLTLSTAETELKTIEKRVKLTTEQEGARGEGEGGGYGLDHVLYTLRDTCVSTTSGEYKYTMCWYGKATQDQTSLGSMEPFQSTSRQVTFLGGTKCWNGPERSFKVQLECGGVTRLHHVEEPSTCVYTATLTTPIACDEVYKTQLITNKTIAIEIPVSPTL